MLPIIDNTDSRAKVTGDHDAFPPRLEKPDLHFIGTILSMKRPQKFCEVLNGRLAATTFRPETAGTSNNDRHTSPRRHGNQSGFRR